MDKCPFCGAYKRQITGYSWFGYACGTWIDPCMDPKIDMDNSAMSKRSVECLQSQLAALTAQVQELKERAEAAEKGLSILFNPLHKVVKANKMQSNKGYTVTYSIGQYNKALAAYDQGKEEEDA